MPGVGAAEGSGRAPGPLECGHRLELCLLSGLEELPALGTPDRPSRYFSECRSGRVDVMGGGEGEARREAPPTRPLPPGEAVPADAG